MLLRIPMNISVCIATYNGEKYIKRQLDSILPQLTKDDEIIISDDTSTDKTIDIIENIKDSRIKILKNNKFYNPTFNFENAIKKATKDIIVLSDQDDIWMKNKVEVVKAYFLDGQCDLFLSDCIVVDERLNIIYGSFFRLIHAKRGFLANLSRNAYIGCCMAFNQKIKEISLPFPRNTYMHDWWIGMIGEVWGNVVFCDEKLIYYVRHGTNASDTAGKSKNSFIKKIIIRMDLILNVLIYSLLNLFNKKL